MSPPGEEEGGLGNRSESVSNCSTGKKRLEKSPSFTSEWDEVSGILLFSVRTIFQKTKKKGTIALNVCIFTSPVQSRVCYDRGYS